jgi:hypothetical protein
MIKCRIKEPGVRIQKEMNPPAARGRVSLMPANAGIWKDAEVWGKPGGNFFSEYE